MRLEVKRAAASTGMFDWERFTGPKAVMRRLWLANRGNGLGGSDMPVAMGVSPWKTPSELWEEKTGRREPEDISDRWSVLKGVLLEDGLRHRFAKRHPELGVINGTNISLRSKAHPHMLASLDGFLYDKASDSWGILEIKTTNAQSGRTQWHRPDGTLTAPLHYMAQVTHYMAVTGFRWGWFYADIGEAEPVEVRFEWDQDDVDADVDAASRFWHLVETDTRPALTGVRDVPLAYPDPDDDILRLDTEDMRALFEQYDAACSAVRDAKEEQDRLRDAIVVAIGDHAGAVSGEWQATYRKWERPERTIPEHVEPARRGRRFTFRKLAADLAA